MKISVMYHINRIKDKSHTIIGAEKALDKFEHFFFSEHSFMITALNTIGIEVSQVIKTIYKNPQLTSSYLMGNNCMLSKIKKKTSMFTLVTSIQHYSRGQSQGTQARKINIEIIHADWKEIKLYSQMNGIVQKILREHAHTLRTNH